MRLNLFLSVASLFTFFYICKAGPLRLHKRATFYIANETACVVDNIVYSSGDPIPTDDPCEACKCRPPGFACVLKDCKVKPGCRAVRRVGECCPEYICGCEHNGRLYQDGEEIRDPKNPCYTCYCQGSSIVCAFVECIFRNGCETEFVPNECCPKYTNCTRDIHDKNPFPERNAVPPVNLLPALNDQSILLGEFPTSQTPEPHKASTDLDLPPEPTESNEEKTVPESETSAEIFNESAETKLDNLANDKSTEDEINKEKQENNLEKVDENKESDETETLLNSSPEIKNISAEKDILKDIPILEKQNSEENTQSADVHDIVENDKEKTETSQKVESTTTQIPSVDKDKNSALEKGKSLRLSDDDDHAEDLEEKKVQLDESKDKNILEETNTEFSSEASTQTVISDKKEISTESKVESPENVSKESQVNSQSASFYNNNEKIKSESAETVTIVVHVKEKVKLSTETDFITDTITPESVTKETQDVPKYNIEIQNIDNAEKSSEILKTESIEKNFEIFPTKNDFKVESTTELSTTSLSIEENIKERSDEINFTVLKEDDTENGKDDLHSQELVKTTPQTFVSTENTEVKEKEITTEQTASVEKDEVKSIGFEIITDSTELPKSEESTKTSNDKNEVNKLEKFSLEGREEDIKLEEKVKETNLEEKAKETKLDEKTEETKLEKKAEETKSKEKAEETKPHEIEPELKAEETKLDEIQPEEMDAETKLKDKAEEIKLEEKAEETKLHEIQPELKAEDTKLDEIQPEEDTEAKLKDKAEEIKLEGKAEETKLEEKAEETKLEEKAEETKLEETAEETKLQEKVEEMKLQKVNPELIPPENINEKSTLKDKEIPILTNVDNNPKETVEITSSELQETSTKTIEVTEAEKRITTEELAKTQNQENEEPKQSEKSS